jgi:hypothetical protein
MSLYIFTEEAVVTISIMAESRDEAWKKLSDINPYKNIKNVYIDVSSCELTDIIDVENHEKENV